MLRPSRTVLAVGLLAATAVFSAVAAGCDDGAAPADGSSTSKLALVAYSTPREVYEALVPRFRATPPGRGVRFEQSYGSSGEQSRAVASGLPADIVALSLAPDIDRLVKAGFVAPDWSAGPEKGMVTESVVVFAVRKGNPKHIRTWDDLVRDDVEVLTPNVFTSGGARWNTMAAYGAQIEKGRTPAQGREYLRRLYSRVSVQDKSAREALQTFVAGKGDVLLAYENEAILAQRKGENVDYVVPDETLLIENPIAVTIEATNPGLARDFVAFTRSAEAQRLFAEAGYRPVHDGVAQTANFPSPPGLFTIDDLGGWTLVMEDFFDRDSGVMAKIFRDSGTPLG